MAERMKLARGGGPGAWRSANGDWTFLRHETDPHPRRWFAYRAGSEWPENEGLGHVTLREAAEWASQQNPEEGQPHAQ